MKAFNSCCRRSDGVDLVGACTTPSFDELRVLGRLMIGSLQRPAGKTVAHNRHG
jgi:hypothetical protein